MKKIFSALTILFLFSIVSVGCGGSSNVEQICESAADVLFDQCSESQREEGFVLFDVTSASTKTEFVDECKTQAEEEPTDEQTEIFVNSVDNAESCDEALAIFDAIIS